MLKKVIAITTAVTIMAIGFTGCGTTASMVHPYKVNWDDIKLSEYMEHAAIEEFGDICANDETAIALAKVDILDGVNYPQEVTYDGELLTVENNKWTIPNGNGLYDLNDSLRCKISDNRITLEVKTKYGMVEFPYDIER